MPVVKWWFFMIMHNNLNNNIIFVALNQSNIDAGGMNMALLLLLLLLKAEVAAVFSSLSLVLIMSQLKSWKRHPIVESSPFQQCNSQFTIHASKWEFAVKLLYDLHKRAKLSCSYSKDIKLLFYSFRLLRNCTELISKYIYSVCFNFNMFEWSRSDRNAEPLYSSRIESLSCLYN